MHLLKGLKNKGSFKYNHELKTTAAHTTDRSMLFEFITSDTFSKTNDISVSRNGSDNSSVAIKKFQHSVSKDSTTLVQTPNPQKRTQNEKPLEFKPNETFVC